MAAAPAPAAFHHHHIHNRDPHHPYNGHHSHNSHHQHNHDHHCHHCHAHHSHPGPSGSQEEDHRHGIRSQTPYNNYGQYNGMFPGYPGGFVDPRYMNYLHLLGQASFPMPWHASGPGQGPPPAFTNVMPNHPPPFMPPPTIHQPSPTSRAQPAFVEATHGQPPPFIPPSRFPHPPYPTPPPDGRNNTTSSHPAPVPTPSGPRPQPILNSNRARNDTPSYRHVTFQINGNLYDTNTGPEGGTRSTTSHIRVRRRDRRVSTATPYPFPGPVVPPTPFTQNNPSNATPSPFPEPMVAPPQTTTSTPPRTTPESSLPQVVPPPSSNSQAPGGATSAAATGIGLNCLFLGLRNCFRRRSRANNSEPRPTAGSTSQPTSQAVPGPVPQQPENIEEKPIDQLRQHMFRQFITENFDCRHCGTTILAHRTTGIDPQIGANLHLRCPNPSCQKTYCRGCRQDVERCPIDCDVSGICFVKKCCAGARAMAIFEHLSAFDEDYMSRLRTFSSSSQDVRDPLGRENRSKFLSEVFTTFPSDSDLFRDFVAVLKRTLKHISYWLKPNHPHNTSNILIMNMLATSFLVEVVSEFLKQSVDTLQKFRKRGHLFHRIVYFLYVLSNPQDSPLLLLAQNPLLEITMSPGIRTLIWDLNSDWSAHFEGGHPPNAFGPGLLDNLKRFWTHIEEVAGAAVLRDVLNTYGPNLRQQVEAMISTTDQYRRAYPIAES